MSWSYRIIKYADDDGYGLHEVYYDANGEVTGWTEDPSVVGDTVKELIESLKMMRICARHRPVFEEAELEAKAKYWEGVIRLAPQNIKDVCAVAWGIGFDAGHQAAQSSWVRIESEADLPKEDGHYNWIRQDGSIEEFKFWTTAPGYDWIVRNYKAYIRVPAYDQTDGTLAAGD
jgi:hypothetical protein